MTLKRINFYKLFIDLQGAYDEVLHKITLVEFELFLNNIWVVEEN